MEQDLETAVEMAEDAGFEVVNPVEVGDLTDIKEDKPLAPATRDVKVTIKKVPQIGKDPEKWSGLRPTFVITDGIDVDGEIKYKNFHLNGIICTYANPEAYDATNKDYADSIRKRKHLLDLKQFLTSVGEEVSNVKINDAFLQSLAGKSIMLSIGQKMNKEGEMENTVYGYTALSLDQQV